MRQSSMASRRPELVSVSAGASSRHSMIANSDNARSISGSLAKCARRSRGSSYSRFSRCRA